MKNKPTCYVPSFQHSEVYSGVPSFLGLPVIKDKEQLKQHDFIIAGAPWEGICTFDGFTGTENATKTIRSASRRYGGYLPEYDFDIFDYFSGGDYGDEVIVTQMEHRCNSAPWFELQRNHGINVKVVRVDPKTCQIDLDDLRAKLSEKTKVAAFNWASNVVGTVSDVKTEDTVSGPRQFHMGTPQYELLPGVIAAVDFIASVSETYAAFFEDRLAGLFGRRRNVVAGMLAIDKYEAPLGKLLRDGLRSMPMVTMFGPAEGELRTPTVPFIVKDMKIADIAEALAKQGVNTWHGDFYAVDLVNDALGLQEYEGVVRLGLAPYNTEADIRRTLDVIRKIVSK